MFKAILTVPATLLRRLLTLVEPDATEDWLSDPLAHPELRVMSMRELADIPFQNLRVRCGR
ncbi:hypothetical protein [Mesorhizobium sp. CAU 1732]|uniref:hypothetical protein n=1 Tax=Mesorhizobium sp. CAU 1732 TaxID=3140358 RepID=UPI0032619D7E